MAQQVGGTFEMLENNNIHKDKIFLFIDMPRCENTPAVWHRASSWCSTWDVAIGL
jgi:hypothetical protein